MKQEKKTTYDRHFIELLFAQLHDHLIDEADAEGLSKMLEPINRLAEQASNGLNFDDEPADFLRVMNEIKNTGNNKTDE